jgi:PLP dependent protein
MTDDAARIAENVAAVRGRIADAAARSNRTADAVALVAVTKYVSADVARLVFEAGCHDLGESRPQQLWDKADKLAALPIRWHLIGHLQRNKARRTLPLLAMLHSVDSPRLLAAIDEDHSSWGGSCTATPSCTAAPNRASEGAAVQLPPQRVPLPILLEVNISGETAKHGFAPDQIESLLAHAADYRHVSIRGLMGMASLEGGLDVARREFAALRELRDRLQPNCPPSVTLDQLSMGMSGDFDVAIEEGATIVRVGSALFEGI